MGQYKACKCTYCGLALDRNTEEWVTVAEYKYAHKICYDKKQQELQEQQMNREAKQKIHAKMKELCGPAYRKTRVDKQIKEYKKNDMTELGMYNALLYWYDIKKQDANEAHGGIGIIPYIYQESQKYWAEQKQLQGQNTQINQSIISEYIALQNELPRQCNKKERIVKPKRKTFFMLD